MEPAIWLGLNTLLIVLFVWAWQRSIRRARILERLDRENLDSDSESIAGVEPEGQISGVSGWLYRAGFREAYATTVFWASSIALLLIGFGVLYLLQRGAIIDIAADLVRSIPGGVGNVLVPFVLAIPWFLIVLLTLVPTLTVRAFRQKRIGEIEQDLPLLLDLLSTLSQAGIGFDAALERVLSASSPTRPLVMEFRNYQADQLAGRPRIEGLRRIMHSVDIQAFSTFISALVQAEQVGAGISETLMVQAADFRSRRREKASAAAMAVPTLLVFPMVIGFLPGIFLIFLGPMIYEASGALGQTLRGVSGG